MQQIPTSIPENAEQMQNKSQNDFQRPSECSDNTIDENVSDSEIGIPLNYNALTNQTCFAPMLQ